MLEKIKNIKHLNSKNFFLIAGPCAIEEKETSTYIAEEILRICDKLKIPFIFKGSYRKANRSKLDSFETIGIIEALSILKNIGETLNVPTITDVHSVEEVEIDAQYVDILQIPAFLSRQTDLIIKAAKTKQPINIKKGQFMSPESMKHAINKIKKNNNKNIMVTDRGTMFGYQDLVVDIRSIPIIKKFNVPIIMDVTHSNQKPNQIDGITSGDSEMIETISKASIAAGANGIFIETHPNPSKAKSDSQSMLPLSELESLLKKLVRIKESIN